MNTVVDFAKAQSRSTELMNQYETYCRKQTSDSGKEMSLGQWVMATHYPDIDYSLNLSLLAMVETRRTSDAKTWLTANLKNGYLPL